MTKVEEDGLVSTQTRGESELTANIGTGLRHWT